MSIQKHARRIRARKIGVLLRDARLNRKKSIEDCASALAIKPEQYANIEAGVKSPSLPELELLSYLFDLPLEHFWGSTIIGKDHGGDRTFKADVLVPLRQRMIGVMLKQARESNQVGVEELAQKTELSEEQLLSYELGEIPIPVPDLQSITSALGTEVQELIDLKGPYGEWRHQEIFFKRFLEMPEDLREFVLKPVNRPYLEVARRLSQLSTDNLRQVAEGLLEITY